MKVHAPNKNYTGVSAGVAFCNGVGETDVPHLLEWFRDHGYEVEETIMPEEIVGSKEEEAEEAEETTTLKEETEPLKEKKAQGKKAGE